MDRAQTWCGFAALKYLVCLLPGVATSRSIKLTHCIHFSPLWQPAQPQVIVLGRVVHPSNNDHEVHHRSFPAKTHYFVISLFVLQVLSALLWTAVA